MNLEQVKEYFKNAKEVKCLINGKIYNISEDGYFGENSNASVFYRINSLGNTVFLYRHIYESTAEIITKKEPKKSEYTKEGKVMLVSYDEKNWEQRVVFMEKNNKFIAWNKAKTIEEAKSSLYAAAWEYAKELPKEVEVTKEEIARWKGCDVEQLIIK